VQNAVLSEIRAEQQGSIKLKSVRRTRVKKVEFIGGPVCLCNYEAEIVANGNSATVNA